MCWMLSQELSNIGTFLSGMATVGLLIVAVMTSSTIKRWLQEKRLEKRSDIAEETLDRLDICVININEWLRLVDSLFVYSRFSEGNVKKLEIATDEDKVKISLAFEKDKYESDNYCREGQQVLNELISVKNHAIRLKNVSLNNKFVLMEQLFKNAIFCVGRVHFINTTNPDKAEFIQKLQKNRQEIEKNVPVIRDTLTNAILFESGTIKN